MRGTRHQSNRTGGNHLNCRRSTASASLTLWYVLPVDIPSRHADWIAEWLGPGELPVDAVEIDELVALAREDHYAPGDVVFRLGQAPTRVHIVREGAIELSRVLKGRRVVLQILRPGDVVGDISVFLRMQVPWDAVALEDSLILSFDSVSLHRLLLEHPSLTWRWLHSVSGRVAGFWYRVVELLAGDLEAQVAAVLIRRNERGVVNLSQTHLAELVGGNRSSVNRILKRLEEQGLVKVHYGQVEVLDEDELARAAGVDGPLPDGLLEHESRHPHAGQS